MMPNALKFPWLDFLKREVFLTYIALIIFNVLTWVFLYWARDLEITNQGVLAWIIYFTLRLASFLLMSLAYIILFLLPCFYLGMAFTLWLEKRGVHHKQQMETAYRFSSSIGFLLLAVFALAIWLYPYERLSLLNLAVIIQCSLVFYIFNGNITDRIWSDIFEKRLDLK